MVDNRGQSAIYRDSIYPWPALGLGLGVTWNRGALPETQPAQITEEKLSIHNLVKREPRAGLAEDVRHGLSSQPKRFLPKYFYCELGSQLFEAICLLPEYYLNPLGNCWRQHPHTAGGCVVIAGSEHGIPAKR